MSSAEIGFRLGDILENNLIRHDRRAYLWGWVAYRDVFPQTKAHISEVCQIVDSIHGPKNSFDPAVGYVMCQEHNCTDEDCGDYKEMVRFVGY
jgi:hypothetical protein